MVPDLDTHGAHLPVRARVYLRQAGSLPPEARDPSWWVRRFAPTELGGGISADRPRDRMLAETLAGYVRGEARRQREEPVTVAKAELQQAKANELVALSAATKAARAATKAAKAEAAADERAAVLAERRALDALPLEQQLARVKADLATIATPNRPPMRDPLVGPHTPGGITAPRSPAHLEEDDELGGLGGAGDDGDDDPDDSDVEELSRKTGLKFRAQSRSRAVVWNPANGALRVPAPDRSMVWSLPSLTSGARAK